MSRVLAVVVACTLLGVGCTAESDLSDASTTAPERTGRAVAVDACALTDPTDVRRAVQADLQVVGRRAEAPTLPTVSCLWGTEFSVAVLEVRVTPGPVAEDTFVKAFGPGAGGEPDSVDGLGDAAYSRSGLTERTLHALADGTVLGLEATDSPGDPLPERALRRLAATAIGSLPANPELGRGRSTRPCARVEDRLVSDVLGGRPRLRRTHRGEDGAVMCSWSAQPGNLVVTVRTDPVQVTNFRANLSPRIYVDVGGIGVEAYSRTDRAGDLLMFLGDALVQVDALPGDGYADAGAPTAGTERRLARALVRIFG